MTQLVNLNQFGFTEEDIKTLVGILDPVKEKDLILKLVKLGNCIKKNKRG